MKTYLFCQRVCIWKKFYSILINLLFLYRDPKMSHDSLGVQILALTPYTDIF